MQLAPPLSPNYLHCIKNIFIYRPLQKSTEEEVEKIKIQKNQQNNNSLHKANVANSQQ